LYADGGVWELKDQLWRFLVTSAVGPGPWRPEERTDEGELVKYESRQFGGLNCEGRRGEFEAKEVLKIMSLYLPQQFQVRESA
jgi:hypothetical protein